MSCTGPRRKVALITGITGQDGSYLAELLLNKGYIVHGIIRRSSNFNTQRIDHIYKDPHQSKNFFLHYGDLTDAGGLLSIITEVWPSEVYNLACQSHVGISFQEPIYSVEVGTVGTIALLQAIRQIHAQDDIKFYQASSSEMFGKSPPPQSETTPFKPRSPYACGKVYSYYQTINYREAYGMFACNGILFNHESPRRGGNFVTKKIVHGLVQIKRCKQDKLYLGNLDAKRDWGFAGDYVEAMWLMLQQEKPDDYVIATGEMHSVREFLNICADILGLDWEKYVEIDKRYIRPAEVDCLCGDASKAKNVLGWTPKTSFKDLIKMMVDDELESTHD